MRPISKLLLYSLIFSFAQSLISSAHAQQYKMLSDGQRLFEYDQLDAAQLLHEIKKLKTVGSVLYVAAHPDDENTRLLSYLANEVGVRTAYLSITRGDGGQNLIGKEQGDLLGLIRTQELLAARRIDGAEQYFTRAVDFGYSKNPEETFKIWNHDSILSDVVWVIRKYKPDVIITRFNSDGSGGHGHHTASSILAQEAFTAAADPTRFPEQLKYVKVWQANRIVWNNPGRNWNPKADLTGLMPVEVGQYNPLLGLSYGEMAGQSRSMHKSQGFGSLERRGNALEYFKHFNGDSASAGLFERVDLTWNRIPGAKNVSKIMDQVLKTYDPLKPEKSVPQLVKLYNELRKIDNDFAQLQADKVQALIIQAAGVHIEFNATVSSASSGETIKISTAVLNRSAIPAKWMSRNFSAVSITPPVDNSGELSFPVDLAFNKQYFDTSRITIPESSDYTMQYWLRNKHSPGLFNVSDYKHLSLAEQFGWLYGNVVLQIAGQEFKIYRRINYKWVDPVQGERYRNLEVVPPITVNFKEKVYMVSIDKSNQKPDKNGTYPDPTPLPIEVKMVIKAARDNLNGVIEFDLPKGWSADYWRVPISLKKSGDEQAIRIRVQPPREASEPVLLKATAKLQGSSAYSYSITRVSYPHIPEEVIFSPAEVKLVPVDIKIAGKKIGYIPGAGDEIPASLRNIGFTVEELSDEVIANSNLSSYDAIITGVRAYNTNDRMPFHYQKLMQYVENGGNLIVQYNTANNISSLSSDMGPFPFKISRDRVTVEESPVTFADPTHPVLNAPNKITEKDFEGWVQERGLYFAKDWDPKYSTPLEMNDPGEKPNKGSLIIAQHGKGHFVYTGISFFRELPAGVPGAYRLFVNLLSL